MVPPRDPGPTKPADSDEQDDQDAQAPRDDAASQDQDGHRENAAAPEVPSREEVPRNPDAPLFVRLKSRYQNWKQELVFKTREQDELAQVLGTEWNELGYHRTIGSFFYTIGLLIPSVLFGLLILPLLQYTRYRFPEIGGFEFASIGLFSAMYTILDLNLKNAIDRYVPEYLIKDPLKAMRYVSFFIKYQMYSGLFQITFVAFFGYYFVTRTEFAYLLWYLFFESAKQYPATLGLFQSLLNAFQRFNKSNLVVFWRANIIEPITQIIFGLIGLWWGMSDPRVGELFGLTLGWAIGKYIDDFFTFGMGTYWLSKILDTYGIRIRDLYAMKVGGDVWKSALGYSMRLMPNTVFSSIMNFGGFYITVSALPGYLTLVGLTHEASNLSKFVGWADDILANSQPALSESYNNGKHKLCKYYLASGLKWWSFWFFILGPFNIFALPVILEIAFEGGFLPRQWALIGVMIPYYIYIKVIDPFNALSDKMVNVSNHPEINAAVGIVETISKLFFTYYFLVVLDMGWLGLILMEFPGKILGFVIRFIFVQCKIIRLEARWWGDIAWQAFIAPALAGILLTAYMLAVLRGLWPLISAGAEGFMLILVAIPTILLLLMGLVVVYIPAYSFLGAWDKHTMRDFRKSVPLTGPSLFITYPLWKIANFFYEKSPFKRLGKMKIGDEGFEELLQLGRERNEHAEANAE